MVKHFDISAIQVPIVYNKYGDVDPNGLMYVLDENKEKVKESIKRCPGTYVDLVQPLVIRVHEGDVVDMQALLDARLISNKIKYVKVVLSRVPNFTKKITLKGLGVTKGAKAAIEAVGGTVEVAQYIVEAQQRLEKSNKKSAAKQQARLDALAAAGKQKPAKKTAEQKAAKKAAKA